MSHDYITKLDCYLQLPVVVVPRVPDLLELVGGRLQPRLRLRRLLLGSRSRLLGPFLAKGFKLEKNNVTFCKFFFALKKFIEIV
jgi:hypothetical protein